MVAPAFEPTLLARGKSKHHWQAEIRKAHKLGKNANHPLSRIIFEATTDLPYGEWTEMWQGEDRPFAVRKAHDLGFVGENVTSLLRLDQAELCLPTALTTLCILGHLPREILLSLIDAGRIHKKLKRKEAEGLLDEFIPQPKPARRPLNVRSSIAKIRRQIQTITARATPADAEFAMKKVQAMIDESLVKISHLSSLNN
jgi:hypothetical protein